MLFLIPNRELPLCLPRLVGKLLQLPDRSVIPVHLHKKFRIALRVFVARVHFSVIR